MRTLGTGWKILLQPHPKKRSAPRQTGRICHAGRTTKVNFRRQLDWIKKHLLSHMLAQASNPSSREAKA